MAACHSRLGYLTCLVLLVSLGAGAPPAFAAGHALTADDPPGQAAVASLASSLTDLERSLERLGIPLRALRYRGPAAAGDVTRGPAAPAGVTSLVEPYWQPLTVIPRWNHSAVYDPVRGRVIVLMGAGLIGEEGPAYGGNGGRWFFGDAQALTLAGEPRWAPLATLPDARRDQAAAIYDATNDRVLVHGGFFLGPVDGPPGYYCHAYDDLWELELSAGSRWNRIRPAGTAPSARYGHTGVYDPARKRALFFGGTEHLWSATYCWTNTPLADLWELSLAGTPTWRQILESGDIPAPGLRGTALYDSARDRMLFVAKDSVWAMTLDPAGSWTRLAVSGPGPAGGPAALDPSRDRLLVASGFQTWELPLAGPLAWRPVTAQGTPAGNLRGFSVTWDPQGDRLVLFGGAVGPGTSPAIASDDTWFLSFRDDPRWERRRLREPELALHKAVYDPVRDRMIAVGGSNNPGALVFSLDSPGGWSALRAGGEGPPPSLIGHGAVYDAKRDRVLVYGGSVLKTTILEDATRELSLAGTPRWSLLPAAPGEGEPCVLFSLVLDSRRDRLLLFGGQDAGGTLRNDVWQLGLADPAANWERVEVSGPAPSPRVLHDAVYDPVRDQMLVAGGETMEERDLGDLWALSLGDAPHWRLLDPYGPATSAGTLVYDPVRDQLLMQFGTNPDAATWAWDLKRGVLEPLDLHCCGWDEFIPLPRMFQAAVYDPVRDQVVVSGGVDRYFRPGQRGYLRDVWALTWGEPVRDVAVDIRPGDPENVVNPGANGVLPVAILSEERFDATTVDPASVKVAGAGVRLKHNGSPMAFEQDVNGDGRADLVLHIESSDLKLTPADTVARLTGMAPGNLTVRGTDRVRIVGNARPPKPGVEPLAADGVAAPALLAVRALPGGGIATSVRLLPGVPARLGLFDVAGRRLVEVELEGGPGGRREATLGHGHALASGIYWVKLEQAGRVQTRKAVSLW